MFHYGFDYYQQVRNEDEGATPRFERLNDYEREVFHAHPLWQLGLGQLCMVTDIECILPETVPHIVGRFQTAYDPAIVLMFIKRAAEHGIDDRDPEEIRETAKLLLADPLAVPWKKTKALFEHWLLDRFAGFRANVVTEPTTVFLAKIKGNQDAALLNLTPKRVPDFDKAYRAYWADQKAKEAG